MATTTGGTTYVTSTDLVADYPTASLALANRVDVVASGSMSKRTASYTVTVADILAGTTICMNSASATVVTLPSTSLVNGMQLSVFSVNTGAVTFTGGTVTGTTTSITAQYSGLNLTYDSAAAVWWALPFGGGSAKATVSGTTGSPTITTVGSKTIYRFTGNGSITFGAAGTCEILTVGGGGGGGRLTVGGQRGGAGGSGGYQYLATATVAAQAYTVVVGGGGTGTTGSANNGQISYVQTLTYALPGGGGAGDGGGPGGNNGEVVGGGGGGNNFTTSNPGGTGTPGQGFNGATGTSGQAGGGGGSSAAGSGGTGGAGTSNSITGSAVTYAVGGTAGTAAAGGANTGNGGGGPSTNSGSGGSGGSGVVIIAVG